MGETFASLAAQTHADFEAIVIDDHSSDDTADRLAGLAASDGRFRVLSLPADRHGAPAARNLGMREARAPLILFLDSDDLLAPHCLEQRLALMHGRPELDFAVFPCGVMRESPDDEPFLWNTHEPLHPEPAPTQGRDRKEAPPPQPSTERLSTAQDAPSASDSAGPTIVSVPPPAAPASVNIADLDRFLALDVPWQTSSPIWRKSALGKIGDWDEAVLSGQDWEYHIRAVLAGLRYDRFNPIDCYWRQADSERESIGKSSFSALHVKNRRETLTKMLRRIDSAGLLTARRKRLFGGMFFQLAERTADKVSRKSAREVWQQARPLVPMRAHLLGRWYFLNHAKANRARRLRAKIDRQWPPELLCRRSTTYLKAQADPARVPAVSVLMSVYNAARYLDAAIDSVRKQAFTDFEFVIVDDGSTDCSKSIIQKHAAADWRVRLISRPNTGLARALNDGLAACRAPLVARMDADDLCLRRRLGAQVAFMAEHPGVVLLGSAVELIDPYGVHIGNVTCPADHAQIDAELLRGNGGAVTHPACMFRTPAVRGVGGYVEKYNNSEDLDLFLRLCETGTAANLPEILLQYRRDLGSVSHSKRENQLRLKSQILTDAYLRRGLTVPAEWHFKPWVPKPHDEQLSVWGWKALRLKRPDAARGHAKELLKRHPLRLDGWKLLFCAVRGR